MEQRRKIEQKKKRPISSRRESLETAQVCPLAYPLIIVSCYPFLTLGFLAGFSPLAPLLLDRCFLSRYPPL
jgi:hypothetical protein